MRPCCALSGPFVRNIPHLTILHLASTSSQDDHILTLLSSLAEKRQAEAARIRDKYPDRIPVSIQPCFWFPFHMSFRSAALGSTEVIRSSLQVIVEKAEKSDIPDIDKKK